MDVGLAILSCFVRGGLGLIEEDTADDGLEGPLVPLVPRFWAGGISVELADDTGLARLAYMFSESALDTDDLLLTELLLERDRERE